MTVCQLICLAFCCSWTRRMMSEWRWSTGLEAQKRGQQCIDWPARREVWCWFSTGLWQPRTPLHLQCSGSSILPRVCLDHASPFFMVAWSTSVRQFWWPSSQGPERRSRPQCWQALRCWRPSTIVLVHTSTARHIRRKSSDISLDRLIGTEMCTYQFHKKVSERKEEACFIDHLYCCSRVGRHRWSPRSAAILAGSSVWWGPV